MKFSKKKTLKYCLTPLKMNVNDTTKIYNNKWRTGKVASALLV